MIKILISVFTFLIATNELNAKAFSVMSYNIRGYVACDADRKPAPLSHWHFRKNLIVDVIKEAKPDILGVQEVFNVKDKSVNKCKGKNKLGGYAVDELIKYDIYSSGVNGIKISPPSHLMRDFIRESMKDLGYASFYKAGGSPKIIFFNPKRFSVVDGDDIVFTNKRSATYVILNDKLNKIKYLFLNLHLKVGKNNKKMRLEELNQIFKILDKYKKYNTIVFGDFNIKKFSDEYKSLSKLFIKKGFVEVENNQHTYNDFGGKNTKNLDYVFISGSLRIKNSYIFDKVFDLEKKKLTKASKSKNAYLYPSDHYPFVLTLDKK